MSIIRPQGELRQREKTKRFTPEEKAYFKWLHEHACCCLTGYPLFDIAHTGKKAMALKAPLPTCLPLRRELHLIEERARGRFWEQVGLPDHIQWANRLYRAYESGEMPMGTISGMLRQADRTIIADMLTNANNF